MTGLTLNIDGEKPFRILCLGAHCDDIEIGCGGTIIKLLKIHSNVEIFWVVFSSSEERANEAKSSAGKFLRSARQKKIEVLGFRNGYFPYVGSKLKDYFENIKGIFSPDLIFTHYGKDLHQDHRFLSELTWNTYRNHMILEYEIPKYDGDFGSPNIFVPLDFHVCRTKISFILSSFPSQKNKHWLTEDLLLSVLRIRGIECVSEKKYAEAFYCRKIILV